MVVLFCTQKIRRGKNNQLMPTILFLYTEVAGYFLTCCTSLSQKANIHIVHWPINKEAPFDIDTIGGNLHLYNRNQIKAGSLIDFCSKINPDIVICSGWIDKEYLKICKKYYGKIPTVLTLDNHWTGSLKQVLATFLSKFFLLNKFTNVWVPGKMQENYAIKLGFSKNQISKGFYCADVQYFNRIFHGSFVEKKHSFPKRLIYTGRYVKHKGIFTLWDAFAEVVEEENSDWELWCVGTGDEFENRKIHPSIKHFGFIQPNDLASFLNDTSVFVLPSEFEPWGVVVHEFAAAGFPLLCSDKVGAVSQFLIEGKNGYTFQSHNKVELKKVIRKIINAEVNYLLKMGEASHTIANTHTPEKWVDTLLNMLK